ncbi:putative nicotianamine synthase [Helianthus anomalus]
MHPSIPPSSINVATLPQNIEETSSKLIKLCGEAEGYLEAHFSTLLATFPNPLHHLDVFYMFCGRCVWDR